MVNNDDKSEKKESTSPRATIIVAVIGAIATVIAAWFGSETKENKIINKISVVVNSGESTASDRVDLDVFLDEYTSLKSKNEAVEGENSEVIEKNTQLESELVETKAELKQKENELAAEKSNLIQKEQEIEALEQERDILKAENTALKDENSKLSEEHTKIIDILLQDNPDVKKWEDLLVIKPTTAKLSDLYLQDADEYRVVESLEDSHGNFHTYAYRFETEHIAFAKYKLGGKYDLFSAKLVTGGDSTTRDARFTMEVFVGDDPEPVLTLQNITIDKESYAIGPISVRNADYIKFIVTRVEGYYDEALYIVNDSFTIVE